MAGSGGAVLGRDPQSQAGRRATPIGACEQLYAALAAKGIDVLYDDLDERPGAKFAAADLIGIPWQILVGPRGLAEGKVELKRRADGARELLSPADALARLGAKPRRLTCARPRCR